MTAHRFSASLPPARPGMRMGRSFSPDLSRAEAMALKAALARVDFARAVAFHDGPRGKEGGTARMIVLHHAWASTCSQKVRLCLAEKGLEWEGRLLNLRRFEHLSPDFLALNPDGFVPVLEEDGFVLRESSVIAEYLDDRFPDPPLRPRDPRGRARVGEWVRFVDETVSPAIKWPSFARNMAPALRAMDPAELAAVTARMPDPAVAERWRRAGRGDLDHAAIAYAEGRLRLALDRAEAALGATRWLAGEDYTLADIALVPFAARVEAFAEFEALRPWPRVAAWLAAIRARPAFPRAGFVEQARTLDQASA